MTQRKKERRNEKKNQPTKQQQKPKAISQGMVGYTHVPSTQEAEAGCLQVKVSLGYIDCISPAIERFFS